MDKLTFTEAIAAPKDKVWRLMLADETYRQWTSVFQEGSYAETDWKEGSDALFLTPEKDGMKSRIVEHRPNEYLSIEHLGFIQKGVVDTESTAVKGWAGARENYSIREQHGVSQLTVDVDITDEYRKYFEETWPKALSKLKEIAEG